MHYVDSDYRNTVSPGVAAVQLSYRGYQLRDALRERLTRARQSS